MWSRPGWPLWLDWCAATGVDPDEVSGEHLGVFQDAVTRSRCALDEVRATARAACWSPGVLVAWRADPWTDVEERFGFAPLEDCLRACPATGWTAGYRGRRTIWLLVLTRGLRLTRTRPVALSPTDLVGQWSVAGHELRYAGDDPASCWHCVAAHWLDCLEVEHEWDRASVRQLVSAGPARTEHVCWLRAGVGTSLPAWTTLARALDLCCRWG